MADTFISGDFGVISVYDTNAWKPIGCLTTSSLNTTLGVIETRTKCQPGVVVRSSGAFGYTIDAEGVYIDTTSVGGDTAKASHDWLLVEQKAKNKIQWRLSTGLTDTEFYYGTAVIEDLTADFDSSDDNNATFSLTLGGDGTILTVDPNV